MIFKTFKGKINRDIESQYGASPKMILTTFSKNWIVENIDTISGSALPNSQGNSDVLCQYTLEKNIDKYGNPEFQITIPPSLKKYKIELDFYNRFKCNCIHNGYLLNKDGGEWFIKTIVATLFGTIIGLLVGAGYSKGYRDGLKESKLLRQDTTQIK